MITLTNCMLKGSKLKYISFKFRIVIDIEEYSEKL